MVPIDAKGLWKSMGGRPVLRGLSLTIASGRIWGLLGRNGAGKTTLMRTLMGLYHPEKGSARLLGASLAHGCPPAKRRVGYVAEGEILPPWARLGDLIAFERGLRDEWKPDSLTGWLNAEGLNEKRKVHSLSKGSRKRFELELTLAGCPSALILDEPLSGLDPVSRVEFLESFLAYAADRKPTVLISSHILTDLERVCDRIGVLAKGKIAFESSMDALKRKGGRLEDIGVRLIRTHDPREAAHA